MKLNLLRIRFILIAAWGLLPFADGATSRLKDIASIRGERANQLMGYGIVAGLAGTGDRATDYTENSLGLIMRGLGVDLKTAKMETKNAAAVLVTATIPPFTKVGDPIDVAVSSIGSATSLDGGNLMACALKGADGKVYAMAQGRIILPRRAERGGTPTILPLAAASIPGGALLEKQVTFDVAALREVHYQLWHPDFTTASRIAARINEELGAKVASAEDAGDIDVKIPYNFEGTAVDLITKIESLEIETDRKAKIVINRRNGTVVLGDNVKISQASIAFNNIRIQIRDDVADPTKSPAAAGAPADAGAPQESAPAVPIAFSQRPATRRIQVATKGASIADIVVSLNEVGAGPEDLVFLVQALRSAGALSAEIELE